MGLKYVKYGSFLDLLLVMHLYSFLISATLLMSVIITEYLVYFFKHLIDSLNFCYLKLLLVKTFVS